jgi:hypothetical protein
MHFRSISIHKRYLVVTVLFFFSCKTLVAQTSWLLRPSLSCGYGLVTNLSVTSSIAGFQSTLYRYSYADILANPTANYAIELQSKNLIINGSFGGTKAMVKVNSSWPQRSAVNSTSAILRLYKLQAGHFLCRSKQIDIDFLAGGSYYKNSLTNYNDPFILVIRDSNNTVVDSTYYNSYLLALDGFLVNMDVRAHLKGKRGLPFLTCALGFDLGFKNVYSSKIMAFLPVDESMAIADGRATGSQIRLTLGVPINVTRIYSKAKKSNS